jgi:hypothetical protein
MREDPNQVILTCRMPQGYKVLRDLRWWKRAEVNAWIKHILGGQSGVISAECRFAWRSVPQPKGHDTVIVESFRPFPVENAVIPWTRTERLYGEFMQESAQESVADVTPWSGLPCARTNHIYSPYTLEAYQNLIEIHAEDEAMLELIAEVASMEKLGPIHVGS